MLLRLFGCTPKVLVHRLEWSWWLSEALGSQDPTCQCFLENNWGWPSDIFLLLFKLTRKTCKLFTCLAAETVSDGWVGPLALGSQRSDDAAVRQQQTKVRFLTFFRLWPLSPPAADFHRRAQLLPCWDWLVFYCFQMIFYNMVNNKCLFFKWLTFFF